MAQAVSRATLDLLTWLSSRSRTYGETMAAWRTTCPRLSIWEDALSDGLVQVRRRGDGQNGSTVVLTERGRAALTPIRSSTAASS
jgi:hypothetical protein